MNPVATAPHRVGLALGRANSMPYAGVMVAVDDTELMLAYAKGDTRAFEQLYVKYRNSLYRYLLRMSNDSATAEDVAQEAWAKLIRARSRYRPDARFSTYLFRIAHNAFIDHTRRTANRLGTSDLDPDKQYDPGLAADEVMERDSLKQRFLAALTRLPHDQRDAYLLHEEAGLSVETVAEVTGVTRETAKSRIRYAVTKLKRALRESETGGDNHV